MFHSMLTKRSVAANRRSARSAAFQVPSGQVGEIGPRSIQRKKRSEQRCARGREPRSEIHQTRMDRSERRKIDRVHLTGVDLGISFGRLLIEPHERVA